MTQAFSCIDLDAVRSARTERQPYNFLVADHVIRPGAIDSLRDDFPAIRQSGFFPEEDVTVQGSFAALLREMKSKEIDEIVSE